MNLIDEEAKFALEPLVSFMLFVMTVASLFFTYLYWWASEASSLWDGVVFAFTFSVIMGAHELGHFLAARSRDFAVSFPMFIPFPVVFGTLGAIIAMKERPPNRRALLEMALAGPLFGFFAMILALGFLYVGNEGRVGESLGAPLLMYASTLFFGVDCMPTTGSSPVLHGVWLSCVVTGLNLVPLRGLDGGRIFQAIGFRLSAWQEKLMLVVLLYLGLYYWVGWWIWVLVILCMRQEDTHVADPLHPIEDRIRFLAFGMYALILLNVFVVRPFHMASGIDLFSQ